MNVGILQEFFFDTDFENSILIRNDYLVYGIVIVYVLFVKLLGPSLMKQRKALDLYYFVILFNTVLVISNIYFCFVIAAMARHYWHNRCYLKYDTDFRNTQKTLGPLILKSLFLKIAELFDTVIFILRKKFNQVTFLHVFHHSTVVLLYWTILKRKQIAYYLLLAGAINCGVHVFTYLYYGLSAIGPGVRKYLWWKKYLTTMQIIQFFILMFYLAYSFLTNCEEFGIFEKITFSTIAVVCALFLNFYFKTYTQKK